MTVAWISTPGNTGLKGVLRRSWMPIAVAPTSTIRSVNAPFR